MRYFDDIADFSSRFRAEAAFKVYLRGHFIDSRRFRRFHAGAHADSMTKG